VAKEADRSSRSIVAIMARYLLIYCGALIAEIAAGARRFFAQTVDYHDGNS